MYSIGEFIDKLIIENIKIFNLREKIHDDTISDGEYIENENKMNIVNENRGIIIDFLNQKVERVIAGKEKNSFLRNVKTYAKEKLKSIR